MKLSDTVYERLTSDQRFRATIEAFSRMDIAEVDRLQDTCGFVPIRVHAPAYFHRHRSYQELAMQQGLFVLEQMAAFWAAMFNVRGAEGERQDKAIEDIVSTVANLKALILAWEEFNSELAIDPDKAHFTRYKLAKELIAWMDAMEPNDVIEPDAERHARMLAFFRDSWRRRLEHVRSIDMIETPRLAKNGR